MNRGGDAVVASHQVGGNDTDDDGLVASGEARPTRGGGSNKKSYQRVVAPLSHGSPQVKSRHQILHELKDQTTAVMESVIFSVFLAFNLLCLLIGLVCWDEGLGTLWMEISGEYEYEYDFGWKKSITVHNGHAALEFAHSNVYDADLEAAGEFFVLIAAVGSMMIISLIVVKLLDMCCECCNRRKQRMKETNSSQDNESWDAFFFIMAVWYGIFEIIYLVSVIAFDYEFIDNCGDFVETMEQAMSDNAVFGDFRLTQYECVEGWGMYFQYLNVILGFTNVILLCHIRKSMNIHHEIDKAASIPLPKNQSNDVV